MTQPDNQIETPTGLCPHFGECGGCATQDVPYEEQVARKAADLRELFAAHWDGPIEVTPSPVVWNYRNKVDFSFVPMRYPEPPPEGFERETVLGFNRKGAWYWPLEIDECRIAPQGVDKLLASVRSWYRAHDLRAFDSRANGGFLRVLLVREGTRTGQRMVVLFTSKGAFDAGPFVEAVQSVFPATSIYRGIFSRSARGTFADELELLDGKREIEEHLHVPDGDSVRELRFRISPFSFFQVNSPATEILYGKIREWVRRIAPATLYDLYGGAGGIAFACSDLVQVVRSIENEPAATLDGEYNATTNGIDNVYFTTEKMKNYLLRFREEGGMEPNSAVVTDPPRSGMTPKAVRRLVESGAPHILYMSCKPTVLVEQLPTFLESYRLVGLQAVDLFPHTAHVEVLAHLERRSGV